MSLSKDIQQKEFRSEYQKAMLNILYTHNHLITKMTDVFKEYDITRQQFNVLRILRGQYPGHASVNLIKDRMLDKMSDTSRIVERLRIKGFISRTDCEKDKRSVEIRITDAGLELLDRMEPEVVSLEKLLHNLTPEEARQLNDLLDKIRGGEKDNSEEEYESMELANQPEKF
jgi:DNA-binding MarR family transcriptional regulator